MPRKKQPRRRPQSYLYRKIYEQHHGIKLAKGMEIHHIDGDSTNNSIENLQAVTTEEHYKIHRDQGDYFAAMMLARKLGKKDKKLREKWRQACKEVQEHLLTIGQHNFQKISKERRSEISRQAGFMTRDKGIGLHAINADPVRSKLNSSNGGKKSFELKRGFFSPDFNRSLVTKNTYWWKDEKGNRKRSKECPGPGFVKGMGPVDTKFKRDKADAILRANSQTNCDNESSDS